MKNLFIALALLLLSTAPALACPVLKKSSPADGAVVVAPHDLTLVFSSDVVAGKSTVKITDAKGRAIKTGKPVQGDNVKTMHLSLAPLPAGEYKVSFDAYCEDCDSFTPGDIAFTVKPSS